MTDPVDPTEPDGVPAPDGVPTESDSTGQPPRSSGQGPIIALTVAILALAAVIAFAVFGGSDDPDTPDTSVPDTSLDTTPTSVPGTTTATSVPDTTAPDTTVTTATTVPETTSTTEAPETANLVPVYFLHDSGGRADRPGPFLAPGTREAETIEEAVQGMLELTDADEDLDLSTAVPEGVTLNGVEVTGNTATVDLSAEFESGGGTFSMQARLAQLVFTVMAFDPDITGVHLSLDGTPVEEFSGEGLILDNPMTKESFQDVTPGILVEWPSFGATAPAPLTVSGIAAAFEGVFQMEILDAGGSVVAGVPFVQTDNGMGWGNFSVTFDAGDLPDAATDLQVHVWELSAEDGSVISERFQPFRYEP